ncbi:MAG: carboxylating nicotinate-nucleotide diphosphorylase [Victivallales bacterium]|nr:carboxylating nicotinate-nucleotide diphosphorylase [Victivallales bacterium]
MVFPIYLTETAIRELCRRAIEEDVGPGDATTLAIVPDGLTTEAHFVTRQECVVCGLPIIAVFFQELAPSLQFTALVSEGTLVQPGSRLATVKGDARAILTGERTALNLLQRLCGIATVTRRYVEALGPDCPTKLLDTRKTTPGLRLVEKYAVLTGGAQNHRIGLYDRIMIKDNHREMAKLVGGPHSIGKAVAACRAKYPALEIEVEADSLEDVREAAEAGVEYILLDNMSNELMAEAIQIIAGRAKTEASGNITLERLPSMRNLGLDYISSGALTHSAKAIDIGLDILPAQQNA